MPELFGYISDTSSSNYSDDVYTESQLDDDYDIDDVITESDLALMEFDQYVQEGVGLAIVAGIGIVAALGGLIALIVHICKKNGAKGTKKQAKKTKDAAEQAKKVPDVNKKLKANPRVKKGVDKTAKAPNKFVAALKNLLARRKNKNQVAESSIYDVSPDLDFYSEALTPSHANITRYQECIALCVETGIQYIDAIEAVIDAAIEAYESNKTSETNDESLWRKISAAIRPQIAKLDQVERDIAAKGSKFGNLETSGVTEEIFKGLTVEEIITLSDLVIQTFDEMEKEMIALKKIQNKCKKYGAPSASSWDKDFSDYLQKNLTPIITQLTKAITNFSVELTQGLGEFEAACNDIVHGKYTDFHGTSVAKSMALSDLHETINRNAREITKASV